MSRILIIALFFLSSLNMYGQADEKKMDFIIVIDEVIPVGAVSSVEFKAVGDKSESNITASYYPGNLSLKQGDFLKLLSDSTKKIYLKFDYYEYEGERQHIYNYKIEINKSWLENYFNIFHVYNLNKEKYRRMFPSVEKSKKYVYELESPSGGFRIIRKM